MEITDWVLQAACKDSDPEIFFPSIGSELVKKLDQAQQICSVCPVQPECLEYAIENNLDEGIWGGLSGNQRIIIRRRNRRMKR